MMFSRVSFLRRVWTTGCTLYVVRERVYVCVVRSPLEVGMPDGRHVSAIGWSSCMDVFVTPLLGFHQCYAETYTAFATLHSRARPALIIVACLASGKDGLPIVSLGKYAAVLLVQR